MKRWPLTGPRLMKRWPLTGPGLTYLTVLMVVPLGLVLSYAFLRRGRFGGVVYQPTIENLTRLADPLYADVVLHSTWTAALTTFLALLFGYPTAYVIAGLPRRRQTIALIAVVLPFWTSFLIRVYAWIVLLSGPGWLNKALRAVGLGPVDVLYTDAAVVTGLLYAYLPLMILPLYASLVRLDPQVREAAANLGAGPWTTFRTVTLPLTLPGVLTGCLFVFVPSFGNFVVPELLGGGRSVMVGNLIRDQFLKARDWPFGSALALALLAVLMVLLLAQAWAARRYATR
ncbi:ABC transporter permease [Streptomyces jeddahensis]|uniref:Spermidine/putrescine transport system permease protein PotB n=1 Tax=Streptomyces jeddahensis TaxID=1716141 RepID=A0A177HSM7_9ACTN|nr:ABC transporter permease [Streptomyces jeddahensis]OAH13726.1 spermidine/putrescine transport system permease protein PotB [Streptomyces jeddahensis]